MYKPPQPKRSSWSPVSTQRQGKIQAKPGWLPVPPKQQEGGSQASEQPSYSPEAFDLMAAKTIRSIEARERRQQLGEAEQQAKSMPLAARGIQAKLTVGEAGDAYEQEADRVAARVMSMPSPVREQQPEIPGNDAIASKQEDWQALRRFPKFQAFPKAEPQASGELENRLNAFKGGGSPLAPEVRAFMEPRFGADFSQVRVHTGSKAVQMNRELGAQAFARGQDIYFGAGKSPGNNRLTAHELTHVVQQTDVVRPKPQKFRSSDIGLGKIPILEGMTPKDEVLSHLKSLGGTANHSSSVYRQEILQFQRENRAEKIKSSQQQILEPEESVEIQQKDRSTTLRKQANPPSPSYPKGTLLGVDTEGNTEVENKSGWVNGLDSQGKRISLFHTQQVTYWKAQHDGEYLRDYVAIAEVAIAEGDRSNLNRIVRLRKTQRENYLKRMSWGSSANLTFRETSYTETDSEETSYGVLNYGSGRATAVIQVKKGVKMLEYNKTYALRVPDWPHDFNYPEDYSSVWFRVVGGPQGDEYLHRGRVSLGCITVTEGGAWPKIYRQIIDKRRGRGLIGTIARLPKQN